MAEIKKIKGRARYHLELDHCLIERIVWQGSGVLDRVRIVAGIWRYGDSELIKLWIRQQRLRQWVRQPGHAYKREKLDAPTWLNKSLGRITWEQYQAIISGVRDLLIEYNKLQADELHKKT
jgi:hypothetical protein